MRRGSTRKNNSQRRRILSQMSQRRKTLAVVGHQSNRMSMAPTNQKRLTMAGRAANRCVLPRRRRGARAPDGGGGARAAPRSTFRGGRRIGADLAQRLKAAPAAIWLQRAARIGADPGDDSCPRLSAIAAESRPHAQAVDGAEHEEPHEHCVGPHGGHAPHDRDEHDARVAAAEGVRRPLNARDGAPRLTHPAGIGFVGLERVA